MSKSGRFAVLWKQVIHNFFQRELLTILLWGSLGTIAAGFVRALLSDHAFDAFLISTYLPAPSLSDEPARYIPYLVTAAIAVAIFILIKGWQLVVRGLRSWQPYIHMFHDASLALQWDHDRTLAGGPPLGEPVRGKRRGPGAQPAPDRPAGA